LEFGDFIVTEANMKKLAVLLSLTGTIAGALQSPTDAPDPGLKSIVQIAIVTREVEATTKR
jgi:hypothetical protein